MARPVGSHSRKRSDGDRPRTRRPGDSERRRDLPLSPRRESHEMSLESGVQDRDQHWVMGRHPVLEALRQGRPMAKIWVLPGPREGSLREIIGLAESRHIPVSETPRAKLDLLVEGIGGNHQGIVAEVAAHPTWTLDEMVAQLSSVADPMLLILDGIQDPHNLGAILRVAEAAGIGGVVIPERGSVGLTAVVDKVSAGAAEYVPVARVPNLANAIETLKAQQFFVFAADPGASQPYTAVDWRGRVGLVIGGEGQGVHPLVRARCDGLIKIPMAGHIESLNASTAAAVVAFEMVRQRAAGPSDKLI
jgi:23S rRNA (guanosine2251-2'-O)-methyltransferase